MSRFPSPCRRLVSLYSVVHVLHRHASLIDMVVPVSHLTGRCQLHVGYVRRHMFIS